MTVQEVKEKLNSVRTKYREYVLARDKAEQFCAMISAPAPVALSADTPSQEHSGNSTENKIVAALWYSEEVDKRFRSYIMTAREIEGIISGLKYYDQREVLTRRYIMFESWKDICQKMEISKSRMFRLHERAIEALAENVTKWD